MYTPAAGGKRLRPRAGLLLLLLVALVGCSQPRAATNPAPPAVTAPPTSTTSPTPPPTPAPSILPSQWPDLGNLRPQHIEEGFSVGEPAISTDPVSPQHMAFCAPDGIYVSSDSGQTWRAVSTKGVAAAIGAHIMPWGKDQSPVCTQVVPDAAHPHSLYATFFVAGRRYGAPPSLLAGYFTQNDGQTWSGVPGFADLDPFGGFTRLGDSVLARPYDLNFRATTDGGVSWSDGKRTCAGPDPCFLFGTPPAQYHSCAMHEYMQHLWIGGPNGSWTAGPEVDSCYRSQLVQYTPETFLLTSASPHGTLWLTQSGGQDWTFLSLPALPAAAPGAATWNSLVMLPDGSLLARRSTQPAWYRLAPKAGAWCAVAGIPANATDVTVIGQRIWWRKGVAPGDANAAPSSLSIDDLRCAP